MRERGNEEGIASVASYVNVKFIRPTVFSLLALLLAGALIVLIGEALLAIIDSSVTSELRRRELWLGVALTVGILAVASFLATRPAGSLGRLDKEVVIGSKPMSPAYTLGPVDLSVRHGQPGTIADLGIGYTIYARNGALGEVIDVLQSVEDVGGRARNLIYARGRHGAENEMWIPIEAVTAVYPDTRSAFLAVSGDEIETYGWHRPPSSFSRVDRPKDQPLY